MFTTFPSTPRGRSRFSKALPVAPGAEDGNSSTTMSFSAHSPLPALPNDAMFAPPKAISRRPVAGQTNPTKSPSIQSLSSVYSDSPGLSRSLSASSSRDTKESLSAADSDAELPPPPPKDKEERQTTNILDGPIGFNGSPIQPELWKRRSIRSEKNIVVSGLKLFKSNGSTASPPRGQEQPTDRALPRSTAHRKPVPARPAPRQPDFMGNKLSKLEGKLEKLKRQNAPEENSTKDEAPQEEYPSYQRLPTPDYLKAGKQQPSTPQVQSPVSPITPAEEPAPQLPPKAISRGYSNTKSTTMSENEVPNLLSIQSKSHSRDSSETLTITSEPRVLRSPQPQKAFSAQILPPQPSPDNKSPPPNPGSPAAHPSYFPTIAKPAPPGAVLPGLPLDVVHFNCFQAHKHMRGGKNVHCPVACIICQKKDTETRWRCTWCNLSACQSCMQVLSSVPGKDLRVCLERIKKRG